MNYFTVSQLADLSGKTDRTIRHHIANGWIKSEPKTPGIRGHRVNEASAMKWLKRFYPDRAN